MTATVHMDASGAITLPEEVRKELGFEPGKPLIAESKNGGLLIRVITEPVSTQPSSSILQIFERARAALSQEDLDRLPVDGAEQHDHYIYGIPKHRPDSQG